MSANDASNELALAAVHLQSAAISLRTAEMPQETRVRLEWAASHLESAAASLQASCHELRAAAKPRAPQATTAPPRTYSRTTPSQTPLKPPKTTMFVKRPSESQSQSAETTEIEPDAISPEDVFDGTDDCNANETTPDSDKFDCPVCNVALIRHQTSMRHLMKHVSRGIEIDALPDGVHKCGRFGFEGCQGFHLAAGGSAACPNCVRQIVGVKRFRSPAGSA
jgi:hypothetical protein